MKFLYTARTESGKRFRDQISATSKQNALNALKQKKLIVTSLTRIERGTQFYIGGVPNSQKISFTKNLAVMLRSGVGLAESLETLTLQAKGKLHEVLHQVHKDVVSGKTLADAMGNNSSTFNGYYVNMVRAGEESGNLAENLELLANRFAKDHEIIQKVKGALLYPAIVLILAILLGVSVTLFVFPKLTVLFTSMKYELPWYTKAMIATSQFLSNFGIQTLIAVIILIFALVWMAKSKWAAPFFHRVYLHIPGLASILHTMNMTRFSVIFGSLLKAGIPIAKALETTGNIIGNEVYKREIVKAVPRVKAGEPFSSVIEESPLFPIFATRMLVIGEQTGKLNDMLSYLSKFYEEELDDTLKNLSTILEPALIVIIGGVVLAVAISIITPIYNFVGAVS